MGAATLLWGGLSFAYGWRAGHHYAQTSAPMATRMVEAGFYPDVLGRVREAVLLDHLGLLPQASQGAALVMDPSSQALAARLAAGHSGLAQPTLWRAGASLGLAHALPRDARYAMILHERHIGGGPGLTGANLFEASLIAFGTLPQHLGDQDFMALVKALPLQDTGPLAAPEMWGMERSARKARRP